MRYAVQVNGHPDTSGAACNARQFIKAVLAKGHEVMLVFFYHEGVLNGLVPAQESESAGAARAGWRELADMHGVDLVLCVSAAERRGLHAAGRGGADGAVAAAVLAPGFRTGGLGQWVDACVRAERVVVFTA